MDNLELELNTTKKRVGTYIRKGVPYTRKFELEKPDHHVVVIDINAGVNLRIINLYRSFRPQGGISPQSLFSAQLEIVKNALVKNCLVMGDFNLNAEMDLRPDYDNIVLLNQLSDFALNYNLTQLVTFNTWSRTIFGVRKESLLDHIYSYSCYEQHSIYDNEWPNMSHICSIF